MTKLSICQNDSILVHKNIIPIIDSCLTTVERYDALKIKYELRGKMLNILEENLEDTNNKYITADQYANSLKQDLKIMTTAYEEQKKISRRKTIATWSTSSGIIILGGVAIALLLVSN